MESSKGFFRGSSDFQDSKTSPEATTATAGYFNDGPWKRWVHETAEQKHGHFWVFIRHRIRGNGIFLPTFTIHS